MKNKACVVFALSDAGGWYWLYTATALASLWQSCPPERRPVVFILHDGTIHERAKVRFASLSKHFSAQLKFLKVAVGPPEKIPNFGRFTVAACFRLLIPKIFAEYDRVLYLDADLVVHGLDMSKALEPECYAEQPLYAVVDPFISKNLSKLEEHAIPTPKFGVYKNSGVLIFNIKKLGAVDLFSEFINWYWQVGTCQNLDQDFLNVRYDGQIGDLPLEYNYLAVVEERRYFQKPSFYWGKVIHYAGKLKPLDGNIGVAMLPFFAYSGLVPEVYAHIEGRKLWHLFPIAEDRDSIRRMPVALE
ncbi:MAG: hypothetical protein RJA77_434 [Pseudomonadota bacterium]|jgi:lipopolysaccharide biosynthesis glycosyltransferase